MLVPSTEQEVIDLIREGKPLAIHGMGSQSPAGPEGLQILSSKNLTGIVSYQPEELVLTAKAGTPMAEIEDALAAQNQYLAFEPRNLSGQPQTLGGVVACNNSGPRRFRAGAARDHVLGVTAVSGRGQLFKSGGKVVKNVTGYDLPKLLTGSFGTLAVMTEITIKVLPAPRDEVTKLIPVANARDAFTIMRDALLSPAMISGCCWLSPGVDHDRAGHVALRLEGSGRSIQERAAGLLGDLIDQDESEKLWSGIRNMKPFTRDLWNLSSTPSEFSTLATGTVIADWGGGSLWSDKPFGKTGNHQSQKRPLGKNYLPPLPDGLEPLTAKIKQAFDPENLLNPHLSWGS